MTNSTQEIIQAIEAAVTWFNDVKITGIRKIRKKRSGTQRGYDIAMIPDPDAPSLWARFYQIGTNKPIFCSRDGIIKYDLADISYERRTSYVWYVYTPAELLNTTYPIWKNKISR